MIMGDSVKLAIISLLLGIAKGAIVGALAMFVYNGIAWELNFPTFSLIIGVAFGICIAIASFKVNFKID